MSPTTFIKKVVANDTKSATTMVEVTGFEPAASCSQSRRATICATPRYSVFYLFQSFPALLALLRFPEFPVSRFRSSKFRPLRQTRLASSRTAGAPRLCPKQARYHLRYTSIFYFFISFKVSLLCSPSCGSRNFLSLAFAQVNSDRCARPGSFPPAPRVLYGPCQLPRMYNKERYKIL